VELVAEGKDALMEEFFEKGTIPEEDLIPALHEAIREDRIFPVLFASGLGNVAADEVWTLLWTTFRHRWSGRLCWGIRGATVLRRQEGFGCGTRVLICVQNRLRPVFGQGSHFRVFSGVLKNDATVQNFERNSSEKFAHLSIMQGRRPCR